MKITLTKFLEYYDEREQKWTPLIWYSKRNASQLRDVEDDEYIEHFEFSGSAERISSLTSMKKGLPSDMSKQVEHCIIDKTDNLKFNYTLEDLRQVVEDEEKLLKIDVGKGVCNYWDDEDEIMNHLRTINELNRDYNLFTQLVYDVHGFVPDNQIRVIGYIH